MRTLIATAFATLLLLTSCGTETDEPVSGSDPDAPAATPTGSVTDGPLTDRLATAEALWSAAGIEDYTMTIRRRCFCPLVTTRVTVSGGDAVQTKLVRGQDPKAFRDTTMEDLFQQVRDAMKHAESVTVRFDPKTGAVRRLAVDVAKRAMDDEYTLIVSPVQVS